LFAKQLSQFWYDKKTTDILKYEVVELVRQNRMQKKYEIACVSCPTLFHSIYDEYFSSPDRADCQFNVKLFEYDKRFANMYDESFFEFYDYNQPLDVNETNANKFDLIIVDPPYLAEECLLKIFETAKHLAVPGPNFKLILCTGQIMAEFVRTNFNLNLCEFEPKHERNLGNQFRCFTNYQPITFK
jgi:hypothetical protein